MLIFAISGSNPDSLIRSLRSFASLRMTARCQSARGLEFGSQFEIRRFTQDDSEKSQQLGPDNLICSKNAERFGKSDGSAAIVHAELAIDIADMHLDRSRREHQLARNLLIREVLVE